MTPNLRLASDPRGQDIKIIHLPLPSISISPDASCPQSVRVSTGSEKGGGKGEG